MTRGALAIAVTSIPAIPGAGSGADLSVFGFTLGVPLSLPECPYRLSGTTKLYETIPAATCLEEPHKINGYGSPMRRIIFGKAEAPPIVKNWQAIALERDGRLLGIEFSTPGATAQSLVLSQLTAKYGKPSETSATVVQNAMGAAFASVDAFWRDGPVTVTFWGTFMRLDTGRVTIDLPEGAALRRAWFEAERPAERKL